MAEQELDLHQLESETERSDRTTAAWSARYERLSTQHQKLMGEMAEAAARDSLAFQELERQNAELRAEILELKRRQVERNERIAEVVPSSPFTMLLLPPELMNVVALHLKSTFQWRSLANLNQTCRAIREPTSSVLYETLVWEDPLKTPWTQSKRNPSWQYTKYLFLHKSSFEALQRYETSKQDLVLPIDAFPRLFPRLVFIILVEDPFCYSDDEWQHDVAVDYDLHLYGQITPMELIVTTCTRTSNAIPRWREGWQSDGDRWRRGEEPSEPKTFVINYVHRAQSITLHKHARLLTTHKYPLEFLQHKQSKINPFEWSHEAWDQHGFDISLKLDIRHLNIDDERWIETMQGCIWLLHTNSEMAELTVEFRPGAEVNCRSEIVLPLVQTYVTQKPTEFFIMIINDLTVSEFVALANSIAHYLTSIPELTQQAGTAPSEDSFLELRAGKVDSRERMHRHRAEFYLEVHEDEEPPRAYLCVSVHAVTRHEETAEAAERVETVKFQTRRELM